MKKILILFCVLVFSCNMFAVDVNSMPGDGSYENPQSLLIVGNISFYELCGLVNTTYVYKNEYYFAGMICFNNLYGSL